MSDSENPGAETKAQEILMKGVLGGSVGIIVGTIVLATIIIVLFWRNFMSSEKKWKASSAFTPPIEREEYIQTKTKSDLKDPLVKDNLRKLLTKRALKAIPIIISLQNEGQSIDRLYKKGMLTDDMHFRVKELKAFVDQEYQDVQSEANDLLEGWGEHVWQQAMQYHTMIQRQLESARAQQQASQSEEIKLKSAVDTKTVSQNINKNEEKKSSDKKGEEDNKKKSSKKGNK